MMPAVFGVSLRRISGGGRHGAQVAVHEDRIAAGGDDGGGGSHEGVGRHQHVAPGDVQHAQDDLERRGAAVHRDGVPGACLAREFRFELGTVLAEGELAIGQHFVDALGDPAAVLGAEIDANGEPAGARRPMREWKPWECPSMCRG
ncbi:MAG: hypothetical protein IPG43_22900 [Proteobacteria bacterium]|nr:hypothetical protein [Pseudomonadota bacterium]